MGSGLVINVKDCIEHAILDGLTTEYSENGEYKLAPSNFPYCSVLHYYYNNKKTSGGCRTK